MSEIQVVHQDLLEQQKNRIYKETASVFSSLQNDIFISLNEEKTLNETLKIIQESIDNTFSQIDTELSKQLVDISTYEAQFQAAVLSDAIIYGTKGEITKVGKDLLQSVIFKSPIDGLLFQESLKNMSDALKSNTIRQVRIGILNGLPVKDIKNSVTAQILTSTKRYEAFVRTAVQNSTQQAKDLSYNKNKKFIKGVQIVAIMDKRTTDICKNYNLQVFDVGKGPRPPFHYNCRTFTIPFFKDEDLVTENDTYDSFNPKNAGDFKLSSNEKGEFKMTTKLINIDEQRKIEEQLLNKKIK